MATPSVFGILQRLFARRFVRDVVTLQVGNVLSMGVGFVKSIVLARLLGVEGFGQYAVVTTVAGTLSVFTNFGQNQAADTFFAEQYSLKNNDGMRTVIKYCFLLTGIAAIILMLLAFGATEIMDRFYGLPALGFAAALAFLSAMIAGWEAPFVTMMQSVRSIRTLTILENVDTLLQCILSVGLVLMGWGVLGIFVGLFVTKAIMLATRIVIHRNISTQFKLPSLRSSFRSKGSMLPMMKQGFWIAVDKNVGNLFPQGFLFVMSFFTSAAVVGFAQLAYKIGSLPSTFILPQLARMSTTVLPALRAQGAHVLRRNCALLVKHALLIHTAASMAALAVIPYFILIFYGAEFSAAITPALWIVLIRIISALNLVNQPLFRLFKKAHLPALWNIVTMPLIMVAMALLMPIIDPLNAFLLAIFGVLALGLWLNVYLYRLLKSDHAF